jgi:short-subunit dehydrogenase
MNNKSSLLVVGGSRGIGLSLGIQALSNQDQVTIIARNKPNSLKNLNLDFISQDFNEISSIQPILKKIKPNTIIFCVGQGVYGNALNISNDQIINCMQTTYISTIFWIKEAINILPNNSRIGWISSLTAKIPNYNWSYYASAKSGVEQFINCIRDSAMIKGTSITICYPGCVATEFHKIAGSQLPEDAIKPSEISNNILEAIANREEFWSSDIDKEVITEAYRLNRIYQQKFKDSLK